MDFSVTICTYNGAQRLPEVLDALQVQIVEYELCWEIIVVDNNSNDDTAIVVQDYQQQWRGSCELRYVFEQRQGLPYARDRAVQEAKSLLVGFLDDDTVPRQNWLIEAYTFGKTRPQVGAYGGVIHAKTDHPAAELNDHTWSFLAVYNHGSMAFHYSRTAKLRIVPAAPGCVVRKQVWEECVPQERMLMGHDEVRKTLRGSCDDLETMYYIQNSKWEIWHNPKMEIWHHIPAKRLERSYLLQVARTSGLSQKALRIVRLHKQRLLLSLLSPFYVAYDALKLITYYLVNRHQFASDINKACLLESKIGRFLSNFEFYRKS